MCRSVQHDPRTRTAKEVDIVIRKDGMERRIEADWVKSVARIIWG